MIYMCRVSSVDYEKGMISVTIPELDGKNKSEVMLLASEYEMPKVDDPVVVLFDKDNGRLGRGVCLGKVWSEANTPTETGKGLYRKDFPDGSIERSKNGEWSITAGSDSVVIGNGKIVITTGEIIQQVGS